MAVASYSLHRREGRGPRVEDHVVVATVTNGTDVLESLTRTGTRDVITGIARGDAQGRCGRGRPFALAHGGTLFVVVKTTDHRQGLGRRVALTQMGRDRRPQGWERSYQRINRETLACQRVPARALNHVEHGLARVGVLREIRHALL